MNAPTCSLPRPIAAAAMVSVSRPRLFPLRRISARAAACSALLGISGVALTMVGSSVFPLADHSRAAFASVGLAPLALILAHVVMGPVLEELIYRGVLLPFARRHVSAGIAIAATSILFGLMHFPMGLPTVIMAVPVAAVFGWLSVRGDSLYPGLICHMAFNFSSGLIVAPSFDIAEKLARVPPGGSVAGTIGLAFPAWWLIASILGAVIAVAVLRRELAAPITGIATGATERSNVR